MEAEVRGICLTKRLLITPEDEHEQRQLEDFCIKNRPLVAVMKHDPSYEFSHIEIRKETT